MDAKPKFVSVNVAAQQLGLPTAWLRAQAKAGRIPCVRAGRRILINLESVEKALLAKTNRQGKSR